MKRFAMLFAFVASVVSIGGGVASARPFQKPHRPAQGVVFRGVWTELGEVRVDGRRDRDVIQVGRRAGKFSRLMVRVDDAAVEIRGIKVEFANGESITLGNKLRFREGERTAAIDLPGEARAIDKIVIRTRDLPRGGKATVEILGLEHARFGRR